MAPTASSSSSSYLESHISAELCGNDELDGDRNRDRDSERERERMTVKSEGSGTVDTNSRGSRDVRQRERDGSRYWDSKGGDERKGDGYRGGDRDRDRLSNVDKENISLQSYLSTAANRLLLILQSNPPRCLLFYKAHES